MQKAEEKLVSLFRSRKAYSSLLLQGEGLRDIGPLKVETITMGRQKTDILMGDSN